MRLLFRRKRITVSRVGRTLLSAAFDLGFAVHLTTETEFQKSTATAVITESQRQRTRVPAPHTLIRDRSGSLPGWDGPAGAAEGHGVDGSDDGKSCREAD